ncbi:hypothetical protein O3G_MSEX002796 [Manduca sexta]|uniref:Uncharacterized protein n=1 Tax=Manduca sexta TaxID=7130 RepID=A0A921YRB5_MANSE|nr:hypothetical protein O3G_MSEX002796 [Manduca sexta]
MALLYHMGCFGKGSASRSKPSFRQHGDNVPQIMRRRQYMKRNYWYKKFSEPDEITESDKFLKELDELTAKIISDGEKLATEDVIDLVSSEEDDDEMQVLYKDGPGINHADYIVVVKHENIHNDWTSVLGHVRMANSTVKVLWRLLIL